MIGEVNTINGIKLLTLDENDGNPFVMALGLDIETKFDENSNNYAESLIKRKTERWFAETGLKAVKRTIDLQTMDGYKGYGELEVKAAPLTFDEYRKYADIIIPHIEHWFWLATGWGRPDPESWASNFVCRVNGNGGAGGYTYTNSYYLAPAFILDKSCMGNYIYDLSSFSTEELLAEIAKRVK